MIVGKVVGSVVSTRKCEKLIGSKFMIIEPVHHMKGDLSQLVAIDMIGAGVGEYVLVAQGSAARIGSRRTRRQGTAREGRERTQGSS